MEISVECYVMIARFEGCKLKAYKCAGGVWTIGYGHTKGVNEGDRITQRQADDYLHEDITEVQNIVDKYLPLTQGQYDALVSFIFNVGEANFNNSTLKKKMLANKNDKTIGDEFSRWVYANGKKLDGLVKRREWEARKYYE